MHISAGVALLMREKKVCEFYFNLGSVFVYQMLKMCALNWSFLTATLMN